MNQRLLLISLVTLSGALQAPAANSVLDVKNKSSFTMENTRNPFWPIGWKPSAHLSDSTGTDHAGADIAPSAFLVTSITLTDKTRFAIVNGKVMQEGQQFGLQIGAQTFQITLKAVQDGRVVFSRRDQEIVVPIRRK
jgi:hypothetical protein